MPSGGRKCERMVVGVVYRAESSPVARHAHLLRVARPLGHEVDAEAQAAGVVPAYTACRWRALPMGDRRRA